MSPLREISDCGLVSLTSKTTCARAASSFLTSQEPTRPVPPVIKTLLPFQNAEPSLEVTSRFSTADSLLPTAHSNSARPARYPCIARIHRADKRQAVPQAPGGPKALVQNSSDLNR